MIILLHSVGLDGLKLFAPNSLVQARSLLNELGMFKNLVV